MDGPGLIQAMAAQLQLGGSLPPGGPIPGGGGGMVYPTLHQDLTVPTAPLLVSQGATTPSMAVPMHQVLKQSGAYFPYIVFLNTLFSVIFKYMERICPTFDMLKEPTMKHYTCQIKSTIICHHNY